MKSKSKTRSQDQGRFLFNLLIGIWVLIDIGVMMLKQNPKKLTIIQFVYFKVAFGTNRMDNIPIDKEWKKIMMNWWKIHYNRIKNKNPWRLGQRKRLKIKRVSIISLFVYMKKCSNKRHRMSRVKNFRMVFFNG